MYTYGRSFILLFLPSESFRLEGSDNGISTYIAKVCKWLVALHESFLFFSPSLLHYKMTRAVWQYMRYE
jgi:hypothetical protein